MSEVLSPVQRLKFEQTVKVGGNSPHFVNRYDVDESMVELSLTVSYAFVKRMCNVRQSQQDLSYVTILNSQLPSFQIKDACSGRIEARLSRVAWQVENKYKRAKGGRQCADLNKKFLKIAIFRTELVDVYNLDCQVTQFNEKLLEMEQKCETLYNQLKNCSSSNENDLKKIQEENSKLYEYIEKLEQSFIANTGKSVDELKGRTLVRKLKTLSTYAEKALWFAESYGLVPETIKCKSSSGKQYILTLGSSDTVYSDLQQNDKTRLRQLVHLLDKFKISDNAYHELSMLYDDMPRKYVVVQNRLDLNNIFHIERTPGNVPGAFVSFRNELQRILAKQKPEEKYYIKVSGDGTRAGRSANLIVISFSILKANVACSTNDVHVIGVIKADESYETLRTTCLPIFNEITEVSKNGTVEINEKNVPVEIVCGGDMKFLQILSGLSGSTSNHPCPWCKCHKKDRHDSSKCWDFYHLAPQKRTLSENQTFASSSKFSVKHPPLLMLEPEQYVPDELHMLMRIGDVLLRNLIDDAKDMDDEAKVAGNSQIFLSTLIEKIRDCGVNFHLWTKKENGELNWSSLSGVEFKKLFESLPEKLFFIIHRDTHQSVVNIWRSFYKLHSFLVSPLSSVKCPEVIFQQCKTWFDDFLALGSSRKGFQKNNITPYMHVLLYHVPYFINKYGSMSGFSGQSVEKVNDEVKKIYHGKCANRDVAVETLTVRKRIEFGIAEQNFRSKRSYHKTNNDYWDYEIFRSRQRKRQSVLQEQQTADEKHNQYDSSTTNISDEMTIDEMRERLRMLGVKTRLKNKDKLLDLLRSSV